MSEQPTRTQAATENLRATMVGILLNFLCSSVSRKVFVRILGKELVGLGSLLGNITVVLTLLDFGGSGAIVFHLYRPLAEQDFESVSNILRFYRRLCRLSFLLTFAAGLLYLPQVPDAAVGFSERTLLYGAYLLQLTAVCLGYPFSAYRLLLFADQKNYVNQWISYCFSLVGVLVESGVLFFCKDYRLYLLCHTLLSLIEDLTIRQYVRARYRMVDFSGGRRVPRELSRSLRREIARFQPLNIAGTLLRTVDNFLVVYLFGVSGNGIYSNYNLLLGYASTFSITPIGALAASVGNLSACADRRHTRKIFTVTSLCAFLPVNIAVVILFVLAGDLMTVWLGGGLSLSPATSYILAFWFFTNGMRRVVLLFRDSYGLYEKERLKPFVELCCALALSVYFGKMPSLGIGGVYLGQALASFFVCFWREPYVLFHYGFSESVRPYYCLLCRYIGISALSCYCAYVLCRTVESFSLRFFLCVFVALLFFCGGFYGTENGKELQKTLMRFGNSQKHNVFSIFAASPCSR